jgi:hypothetical protein
MAAVVLPKKLFHSGFTYVFGSAYRPYNFGWAGRTTGVWTPHEGIHVILSLLTVAFIDLYIGVHQIEHGFGG